MALGRSARILLIEDNSSDARLLHEAFSELKLPTEFLIAKDGEQAMTALHNSPAQAPDLIMLDLTLPVVDGRDVLTRIKQHPEWRRIPVVVITSSRKAEDIFQSYDSHANCYVPKPLLFEDFLMLAKAIESFWFGVVRLPNRAK